MESDASDRLLGSSEVRGNVYGSTNTSNGVFQSDNEVNSSSESDAEREREKEFTKYNLALPKAPILLSLWLGSFLSSLDSTIVANIMNSVAEGFDASNRKQWIATSYLLTNAAFQPLYGKYSDLLGRKIAVITALTFFGLGCFMTSMSKSVTQFCIARAVCGIGGGGITAMSSITVSDICTAKDRGIYQGYANIVFGLGQVLGAPLGGIFIQTVGWRLLFALQVPMVIISSFLAYYFVNVKLCHLENVKDRFSLKTLAKLDLLGTLTLVMAIGSLFISLSKEVKLIYSLPAMVFSLLAFAYVEKYVAQDTIIPFHLMKGTFIKLSFISVISSFIVFGEIFRTPIYLQMVQNMSVVETGVYLIFPAIFVALGSLATGSILKTTKLALDHCAFVLILLGTIMHFMGLSVAYIVTSHMAPDLYGQEALNMTASLLSVGSDVFSMKWKIVFVASFCVVSFGYAAMLVSTLVIIVARVQKSELGTITGVFYLWRSLGTVLGTSITLTVYELSISSKLWKYMFKTKHIDHTFTKDDYKKLLENSAYLRKHFPDSVANGLLYVYRSAFAMSYLPNISLSLAGIIFAYLLLNSNKKQMAG